MGLILDDTADVGHALSVQQNAWRELAEKMNHWEWTTMIGRGEMIRTSDPLHPMQVRYQAALRPDRSLLL